MLSETKDGRNLSRRAQNVARIIGQFGIMPIIWVMGKSDYCQCHDPIFIVLVVIKVLLVIAKLRK